MFHAPQALLIEHPLMGLGNGNNGFFRTKLGNIILNIQASDGFGWEHVSVSLNKNRCPTWEEMNYVKDLFWDNEDCVIQYHPPKSNYVNNHNWCLHLWRPIGKQIPVPNIILV